MKRRRLNQILRVIVLGCAVAAIVVPTAQAHPLFSDENLVATPTTAPKRATPRGPSAAHTAAVVPPAAGSSSFDWADAGVGFGVAVGLTLLLGAAVAMTRSRRPHVSL